MGVKITAAGSSARAGFSEALCIRPSCFRTHFPSNWAMRRVLLGCLALGGVGYQQETPHQRLENSVPDLLQGLAITVEKEPKCQHMCEAEARGAAQQGTLNTELHPGHC